MRHIKLAKNTSKIALLLLFIVGLSSCIQEDFSNGCHSDCNSVTLRLKLPKPKSVFPMSTRAEATDFDVVNDLNILISDATDTDIKKRLFIDLAEKKWGDGTEFTVGEANADGVSMTIDQDPDVKGYYIYTFNFDNSYWSGVSMKDCKFHAIANMDYAIESDDKTDALGNTLKGDEGSVSGLRNLKVYTEKTTVVDNEYNTVPTPNAMYGTISDEDNIALDSSKPNFLTRVVTVDMKRTAAMITLMMDGANLYDNVVIDIESVTLRNVPTSCTLGGDNKPADHATEISLYGDNKGGPAITGGYKLIGTGRQTNVSGYTEEEYYKTSIGGHFPKNTGDPNGYPDNDYVSDVTGTIIQPLFLFENKQGEGEAETDQIYKRPKNVNRDMTAIANHNATAGVCSYIEIVANYTEYDLNNLTNISRRGKTAWRFFLGHDATQDFNVDRNTNYRLTLTLSGTGIGEANSSWRVDDGLKTPEVVGNPDMVVGGGGEAFCVELAGNLSDLITNGLKLSGPSADFVYVYTTAKGKTQWWPVSDLSDKGNTHWDFPNNKQIWFFVQPLMPGDTEYWEQNERSCSIEFQNNSGVTQTTISFTQYRPVTFSLTQTDLSSYPNDPYLQKAYNLLKDHYNHDVKTQGDFTFYADRIDREEMPWGFSGIQLDYNQANGFENVYHLIKPLTVGDNCAVHVNEAEHYLPTGKGYRTELTENAYIDYSKGSCMVHAAMENYFQQYYPNPNGKGPSTDLNVSPNYMVNLRLENIYRPGSSGDPTPTDRLYSWCVPSIIGCQLVESLQKFYDSHDDIIERGFDPKYPLVPWVSYWTSNAATLDLKENYPSLDITGKNRSFVYQFDTGLDDYDFTKTKYPSRLLMPRSTAIKYRLLNIRPDDI